MRVQQSRKFNPWLVQGRTPSALRQRVAEVEQQAQGIKLREIAAPVAPFFDELPALRRRREGALQDSRRVVVEAQVCRGELLFQNRHPREQRQRSALHAVRRPQPYLALTLEERARNPPANVFCKSQRAVVQIKMEIGPVNRGFPNVVHALGIERDRPIPRVEPAGSLRTIGGRCCWLRPSCRGRKTPSQPDPPPNRPWLHKLGRPSGT